MVPWMPLHGVCTAPPSTKAQRRQDEQQKCGRQTSRIAPAETHSRVHSGGAETNIVSADTRSSLRAGTDPSCRDRVCKHTRIAPEQRALQTTVERRSLSKRAALHLTAYRPLCSRASYRAGRRLLLHGRNGTQTLSHVWARISASGQEQGSGGEGWTPQFAGCPRNLGAWQMIMRDPRMTLTRQSLCDVRASSSQV
ncbi:hypothetical protein PsYK624_111290 [Phanerochaete sordida]|uniref:Uncharacterized protein n=1 Tax=Phanerochaete sordida TaxID=48140 RepID=A0A9P3GF89_9APHY|nr:hypothetical protein PsYK624_111290 [Phanerochaete sordida]